MEKTKLIEVRNAAKKRKPTFVIKDTHKKSRVPARWRKPRGKHSPVRQHYKGKPKVVSTGYSSPKAVKHLHSSGLQKIPVNNKKDLETIDPLTQGIVISSNVGNKNRIELIKIALEKKINVLNLKDAQKHLDSLLQSFQERKKTQESKQVEKSKIEADKKKEAEEKTKREAEEKKKENSEKNQEEKIEKKEAEKKEFDKTLTKKQ
ncbi:50S ribosomal protein L32e [Candidatus Woesearchaeota archaeon]|jgi:large subunit ribosomal protein L32e|nr:50S ribosomal protein L32e [Candidatus Woesearchaeota archaeon]